MKTTNGACMNLQIEMLKKGVNRDDIAKLLNVSRVTAYNKLDGVTQFYLDEAIKIQRKYFPDKDLIYLFRRTKKVDVAKSISDLEGVLSCETEKNREI